LPRPTNVRALDVFASAHVSKGSTQRLISAWYLSKISVLIYRPRACRHAADKPTVRNSDQIEVVMSLVDTAPSSAGKRYPQHARSDCNQSARWE
jgi:hypothetical protein